MKRMILVISFALVSALSVGAQGRGHSAPTSNTHSNGPNSTDRDKGTNRAADVGKKERKGQKEDQDKDRDDKENKGNKGKHKGKGKDKGKKGNTPPTSKKS